MRTIILTIAVILAVACSSGNQDKNGAAEKETANMNTAELSDDGIRVLYFHLSRRCLTCNAIEKVSKEYLQEKYGDSVPFESFNFEEESTDPVSSKYDVTGQSLIIVNGDKKIDLTADAFMNALSNPDKLKELLDENITAIK